jgi:hypothetical protein
MPKGSMLANALEDADQYYDSELGQLVFGSRIWNHRPEEI